MEARRHSRLSRGGSGGAAEVFGAALRLGLTSFGGPVAHLGYFRKEYVEQRRWLDEQEYSELVAVTNLLPGPTSSQLGVAIGARRAGAAGGLAAWLGFTLPSAVAMTLLALTVGAADVRGAGWIHGLELVAAPVVLVAVVAMARSLAPGLPRFALAAAAAALVLLIGGFAGQVAALGLGAAVGALALFRVERDAVRMAGTPGGRPRRRLVLGALVVLVAVLAGLPALAGATDRHDVALVEAMTRSGSLVFGGGHVVLPLLHEAVVAPGWVDEQEFLAGYGLAQAMPGPLFTFSAYLGAIEGPEPNGVAGASLALLAIFLPSFLLLAAALPVWSSLRRHHRAQAVLRGVAAAVVGLLAAAFWDPVLRSSIDGVADAGFAAALLVALRVLPVWAVVPLAAGAGQLFL